MRRLIGTGLALLVALAVGPAAWAQATPPSGPDTAITPGQSVGTFQLGENIGRVVDALGPLHSQETIQGTTITGYYWPLRRIGAFVNTSTSQVEALAVSLDETYHTAKGIGAGSAMDAVRTAYGPEDSVDSHQDDDTLVYDKLGIAFVIDKTGALGGRVSLIFVFAPGQYKGIFQQGQ